MPRGRPKLPLLLVPQERETLERWELGYLEPGRRRIRIVAPFVRKKKSEIIRLGLSLGAVALSAWEYYQGEEHYRRYRTAAMDNWAVATDRLAP